MHLYLDSARLDDLEPFLDVPAVYGVTTNPTLQREAGLAREALPEFVGQVLARGARAVHVQVAHADAASMIEDGLSLWRWAEAGRVLAKLPATREGLRATHALVGHGVPCTVTAVFAPEQALWARLAGASYAAPYLGRLNDQGEDGLRVVAAMQSLLDTYPQSAGEAPCRLLVASVRTRADALNLMQLGVGAMTVKPALAAELLDHPATKDAEALFLEHAAGLEPN